MAGSLQQHERRRRAKDRAFGGRHLRVSGLVRVRVEEFRAIRVTEL